MHEDNTVCEIIYKLPVEGPAKPVNDFDLLMFVALLTLGFLEIQEDIQKKLQGPNRKLYSERVGFTFRQCS